MATFPRPPGSPETFVSPLGTRGSRGVKERQGQSEEDNVNARREVADCLYKEKTPPLKEIFVANGLKKPSYKRGTEGCAAESTFGDV